MPDFRSGDSVRVHTLIKEGDKERVQVFEGVVIGQHRGGSRASFTVRKVSYGVGVERIFPLHTSRIEKIEVVRRATSAAPASTTCASCRARPPASRPRRPRSTAAVTRRRRCRRRRRPPPPAARDAPPAARRSRDGLERWPRRPRHGPPRRGSGRRVSRGARPADRRAQLAPARGRAGHRRRRRRHLRLRRGPLAHGRGAGHPLEAITPRKRARVIRAARLYLDAETPRPTASASTSWR